eukprot:TRINITY_DN13163_c0_g1_i1.p1 TRINITY_DN13163_c0_g1~~TRINITY_DN13163_c0_g1_i1.p1  ORF type:complete len:301 (-),score=63.33 TRINITY_DN13163_c0_g1_i1:147-1049(-)
MSLTKSTVCVVLALVLATSSAALDVWGADGHQIAARIAEERLSATAKTRVSSLLGGKSMASVAMWADEVRNTKYPWSAEYHYVNIPDGNCGYSHSRDCASNKCVTGAIANYTTQLFGEAPLLVASILSGRINPQELRAAFAKTTTQAEALQFLIHFAVDVHQPLHVGYSGDLGGNRITVYWYGSKTNLHAVWDSSILGKRKSLIGGTQDALFNEIKGKISGQWSGEVGSWTSCSYSSSNGYCSYTWANEAASLCCSHAYRGVANNAQLGDDYYNYTWEVSEKQVAKAGVRLAALLNYVFR